MRCNDNCNCTRNKKAAHVWKRILCSFLALTLVLCITVLTGTKAEASIIPDTTQCLPISIVISDGTKSTKLNDAKYTTTVKLKAGTNITVSSENALTALYIVWDSPVPEWNLLANGEEYSFGTHGYLHEYVELPEALNSVTIVIPDGSILGDTAGAVSGGMRIADIYAFSGEEVPDWVQRWQPVGENVDILMIPTHADDEQLFFGSIIPTYAAEQNLKVQLAFMTQHWGSGNGTQIREHEKLNGIWRAGCVNYPIMGSLADVYSKTLAGAKLNTSMDSAVQYITDCIRRTRPLVVISHDTRGEYKHGQHMLTAQATITAVELAADSSYYPDSAEQYGTWRTPKLYLHLFGNADTVLDMRKPLAAFEGKTALQVASDAYKMHESQQKYNWFVVSDTASNYRPAYGLYRSMFGPDKEKNDLLENIPKDISELRAFAANEKTIPIYSVNDLEQLRLYPYGNFSLMNDIDCSGYEWIPLEFHGVLNGNGNSLLNLRIIQTGESLRKTFDGNSKEYETEFSGLFSVLENAIVKDFNIYGMVANINSEGNCFIGGISGYCMNSSISNCTVSAELTLNASGSNFGVAGIVGCGSYSNISHSTADVTLVCIDNDVAKDEQFLGGIYSLGQISLNDCTVNIRGYVSEHGFVHTGGLIGLCMKFPPKFAENGIAVTENLVEGFISFYEDVSSRRAYCKAFIGEDLYKYGTVEKNTENFVPDEHRGKAVYETTLLPHNCENPGWDPEYLPASDCTSYSCTKYTCITCGEYSYLGDWQPRSHELELSELITLPTEEQEGFGEYICSVCGANVYAAIPMLESESVVTHEQTQESAIPVQESIPPQTKENPSSEPTSAEQEDITHESVRWNYPALLTVFVVVLIFVSLFLFCLCKKTSKSESSTTMPETDSEFNTSRKRFVTGIVLLSVSMVIGGIGAYYSLTCTGRDPVVLTPLPNPMNTVNCFFKSIHDHDYETAYTCLKGYQTLGLENTPEDEHAVAFWNIIQDNISWEQLTDCVITGTSASVDVLISYPDLVLLTSSLGDDVNSLLENRAIEAFDPSEVYDEDNNFRSELVMEYYNEALLNLISEENYPICTDIVTISLIYSNKEWKITPDSTLFSALAGGVS